MFRLNSTQPHLRLFFLLTLVTWLLLIACQAESTPDLERSSPNIPQLTVDKTVRGAFLGLWSNQISQGSVWFVGGEVLNNGDHHSLIANYTPPAEDNSEQFGTLKLIEDSPGGILWWVWGSGQPDEIWAAGEQGRILKMITEDDLVRWEEERVLIDEELKEKLVIWGLWGHKDENGITHIWGVGGSVRRGGPKGVLLKRTSTGVWERVMHELLPVESNTNPILGRNLYKIWGTDDQVWIVGEGSYTLNIKMLSNADGLSLNQWNQINVGGDRPELLFTVAGSTHTSTETDSAPGPWLVGGLAEGKTWRWTNETSDKGEWQAFSVPPTPALNGINTSQNLVLAVGAQGSLLAWHPNATLTQSEQVHHQWVRGAENMTLHSTLVSSREEFWIVGGDLTTFKSGVIIPPQVWSDEQRINWETW